MLAPIFTHGTYENTIKAIQEGKIKYPCYCWITDREEYGFLNKQNQLETIGIPCLTGTIQTPIILSALDDGLYQVKGQHKITADHATTFDSGSFILVVVQTIGGIKKVARIASDELVKYTIEEDLSVTEDAYITESYLKDKGYATEEYLDAKIAILKHELENEIEELVEPVVEPMVIEIINREITGEDDESIEDLFDE